MAKGDYRISDLYQGSYNALSPPSDFSNNYMRAGSFGMTTDPRNANILQEVSSKLSSGVKQIEVEGVIEKTFDSIPKQHLQEVNRLAKLTGIDVSLHGPVMDVAGFTQNGFSENDRELAERKVIQTLMRSHDLNPDGNIPVNFHSAEGIQGSQLLAPKDRGKSIYKRIMAVNRENGRMAPIESDVQYSPGGELKADPITPEERLGMQNRTEWDNNLSQLIFNKERADELLERHKPLIEHFIEDIQTGKLKEQDLQFSPEQQKAFRHYRDATAYLRDLHKNVVSAFSKAVEFGDENQKQFLEKISKEFGDTVAQGALKNPFKNGEGSLPNPFVEAQAMHELLHNLKNPGVAPKMWVPIEEFAVAKTSQTYGNAAFAAYKEFKDKSPILVIENPPAGFALSTGKDIQDLVKASRKKFVENLTNPTEKGGLGMSEKEANKQAEKFIGATWDVGHINMLRKFGYSEQDIIKESEAVAPFIKHVHLSDNFGYEHTELPMGMGNVPLKQIMEKLGEKGFNARKIIEAADWWQHFRTPPFQEVLESTNSPLYAMNMAPYWSQAPGLYQGYSSGLDGQWLPQINYETFGGSFSRLPKELGGTTPGAQGSRMSGRQME